MSVSDVVPGEGLPDAVAMIVGEAPGFEERKAHRPFVGKSGQLLFMHLGAFGLSRADFYITNVVKTVPLDEHGKIRRPTAEEIEAWSTFLAIEIENTAPAAILCLGRTAVDHLMPEGTEFGMQFGTYYSAWHPAHLLYDDLNDDGKLIRWIEQLSPFAGRVHVAKA